jgi:hypothetical protein
MARINRKTSKTVASPAASLVSLVNATFEGDAKVQGILDAAMAKADEARGTVFAAFIRVGTALRDVHPNSCDQAAFDEAYKVDVMAAFIAGHVAKGRDEKAAKLRAGTDYNNFRAALLGIIDEIDTDGFTSYQMYAKHVRDEAPDLFTKKAETRGRKAGSKVKSVKQSIDVKELSGKRGAQKDVAQEVLDLIRIAKERGMLEAARDVLAELLEE